MKSTIAGTIGAEQMPAGFGFVPIVKQRESAADTAIQFFKAGSDEAEAINAVHLKEVDKTRHTAKQVVL